jgi:mannosylglycerate hydrolase
MSSMRKTVHIISTTHWDSEWIYPFEETRLQLLELMDRLLGILDTDEEFHSFTFDAQTLGIQDYLELLPEMRDLVEKHVKSGRLIIGPWFVPTEEFIVNGESLVRNLLLGDRIAASLGKATRIGYSPRCHGAPSQIPQIFQGLGIDTLIVHDGPAVAKSEFVVQGPDGSSLLGVCIRDVHRSSYYFYVYRMLRYGMETDEWRYDWERGAHPFRLATDGHPRAHYEVLDPEKKKWLDARMPEQLIKLIHEASERFSTRHIACLQGSIGAAPDARETEIARLCQDMMSEHTFKMSSLNDFVDGMRQELQEPASVETEVFFTNDRGESGNDAASARHQVKQANARNENLLQRWAEPWSALALMAGGNYMKHALDRAWSLVLRNQAYHAIAGSAIDQTERDVLNRAQQADILAQGITRRALSEVQSRIDNSDFTDQDLLLTVYNPSPFYRSGVISALVDLPGQPSSKVFCIRQADSTNEPENPIRMQEANSYTFGTLVRSIQDVPLELQARRVHCHIKVNDIPPLGYRTYSIGRGEQHETINGTLAPEANVLENESLRAVFHPNGVFDLTHKDSKYTFRGLHYFEDAAEIGHVTSHIEPRETETYTSLGCPVSIVLEEAGPLLARLRVDYAMRVPAGLESPLRSGDRSAFSENVRRSAQLRDLVISSRFTLREGERRLDIHTTLENTCESHRLRVVFPTHLKADHCDAESAFDVVSRSVGRGAKPMQRFVDMSDGKLGLAILNDGIREYEAADLPARPLTITLLRAFAFRQSVVPGRWEVYPEMALAQCPGRHEWRYAVYPHAGDWTQGVYEQAEMFTLPLEAAQSGARQGSLPKSLGFVELTGENLQLAALKRAEDRPNSYIARIYNPTRKTVSGTLNVWHNVKQAWSTNLNEERRETLDIVDTAIRFKIAKKKILTVEFQI